MTIDFDSLDSVLKSVPDQRKALEALKEGLRKMARDKHLHMNQYRGDLVPELAKYVAEELGHVVI